MSLGEITLAVQVVTLVILTFGVLGIIRTTRLTKQTTKMIESYRRELSWLTARLEALEAKARQGNGK